MSLIDKAQKHKRDFEEYLKSERIEENDNSPKKKENDTKKRLKVTIKKLINHPDENLFALLFDYVIIKSYSKIIDQDDSNLPHVTTEMVNAHKRIALDIKSLIFELNGFSESLNDEKMINYLDRMMDFLEKIHHFRSFESVNVTSQNIPCFITQEHSGKGQTMKITFMVYDAKKKSKFKIEKLVSKQWCSFIESWCFIMKTVGTISAYACSRIGPFNKEESLVEINTYLRSKERKKDEKELFNSFRRSFIFFKNFFHGTIHSKNFEEKVSPIWFQL